MFDNIVCPVCKTLPKYTSHPKHIYSCPNGHLTTVAWPTHKLADEEWKRIIRDYTSRHYTNSDKKGKPKCDSQTEL